MRPINGRRFKFAFRRVFAFSTLMMLTAARSASFAQGWSNSATSAQPDRPAEYRALPDDGLVSVQDLAVSAAARKELAEANRLISQKRWEEALHRLRHVVSKHARYAVAHNNLGVVYSHVGDFSEAREALTKAIEIDPHFALAYQNLGRLSLMQNDFEGAETLLSKAATFPPLSLPTWNLLAYAQLKAKHYDQALETCGQAHAAHLPQHGFLHLVAAHAYGQKHQPYNVIAELQQYLSEEPDGSHVEEARRAITNLNTFLSEPASGVPDMP